MLLLYNKSGHLSQICDENRLTNFILGFQKSTLLLFFNYVKLEKDYQKIYGNL